jgi:hypothetical protein
MGRFNRKLVESLDILNKCLAVIFAILAGVRFWDTLPGGIVGSMLETLTVVGVGILTCGYLALMLSINQTLEEIKSKID